MLNYFRCIFSVPASFVIAVLISGLVSIVQNFIVSLSCAFMFIRPHFIDCSVEHNQRTFLADIVFYCLFIGLSGAFMPKNKEVTQIVISCILAIINLVLLCVFVLHMHFSENTFNIFISFVGLLVYAIVQIKSLKNDTKKEA